jgi:DHA2 family methylenomycin A resistance protein-like MFS transporter
MALIGEAFPNSTKRARAVAVWAMGGAIASTSGPVAGGLLTLVNWRLIFFINLDEWGRTALAVVITFPSAGDPSSDARSSSPRGHSSWT